MIVSGSFGKNTVPAIVDLPQLYSIYVFCQDIPKHEPWAREYRKVKGLFDDIKSLCKVLEGDIKQCDNNLMSISIVSKSHYEQNSLDALDPSFMYSKLLKEILMQIEHEIRVFLSLIDIRKCCK